MKLKELLRGVELGTEPYPPELDIASVAVNSKHVKRGGLFVAIKGFTSDGHEFVKEALERGARAVLVERVLGAFPQGENIIHVRDTGRALSLVAKNFYHSPSEGFKVIGITGTNGKTTTSFILESIFESAKMPCGVIGTIDYRFGGRIIPAARTTPDVLTINELLSKMLGEKMKAAVMEVSSHALRQERVRGILFDAAIFTNLTHEHLDYHDGMEDYFASKLKIFSRLKGKGIAIINADDERANRIKGILKRESLTFGIKRPADIRAGIKTVSLEGSSFTVKIKEKDKISVDTELIGSHNISNILAAAAAGISQGVSLRAIKEGIERVRNVKGRLEPVSMGQDFRVFVDYAHTHDALARVLGFLNRIKAGRIITVFGCGGERDRKKRPLMGMAAQNLSDFVIVTNDNPRAEDPRLIVGDIEGGMNKRKCNYEVIFDREKAIEKAFKKARSGDIVLIAGKGHETELVLADKTIDFDDRKVAEEMLSRVHKP